MRRIVELKDGLAGSLVVMVFCDISIGKTVVLEEGLGGSLLAGEV